MSERLKFLLSVPEAAEAVGDTVAAFRHKIFHASKNGLEHAIVRVGRSVRIDPERLAKWVENLPRGGEPFTYDWQRDHDRKAAAYEKAKQTRREAES